MPLGLKVSRRNCVNMQKEKCTWGAYNLHPRSQHLNRQHHQQLGQMYGRNRGEYVVASTGPIHTKLIRHIARDALPTLRTSSDRLQSPRN